MSELVPNSSPEDMQFSTDVMQHPSYANEPIELGEYRPLHPKREAATILGAISLIAIGTKILYGKLSERLSHER